MHAEDPLRSKKKITPGDLDNRPLATLYDDHPANKQTRQAFEIIGARFKPRFQTQYFVAVFSFVQLGRAFSIMDRLTMESYLMRNFSNPRIVFKPFSPRILLRTSIVTPTHRPTSLLAEKFYNRFKDTLNEIKIKSYN